jgi:hypothetical protein
MRKLYIGFVSLGIVLIIFLLYSRVSKTPPIENGKGTEFIDTVGDSNMSSLESDIGKVGEIGLGPVKKAQYVTLNEKTKEVESEWGFEKLLHAARDIWEIEKPYMNIYQRDFKCFITADKGEVEVETAVGKPTPKDATFTGQVVIHILPEGSSDIKESFIYLDDIIFLSERSQISTAGPVEYISQDAQMEGTGLELVYNEQAERLEYFRIVDVKSLRIKSSQMAFLSSVNRKGGSSVEPVVSVETQQTAEPVVAAETNEVELPLPAKQSQEILPQVAQTQPERKEGGYYKCIFRKNVVIDTPEQYIFARQNLSISDIFWSRSSRSELAEISDINVPDGNETIADANKSAPQVATSADSNMADANDNVVKAVEANDIAVAKQSEPNKPPEKYVDIIVTCEDGVVLIPEDYPVPLNESFEPDIESTVSAQEHFSKIDDDATQTRFFARNIDYNVGTGDVVTDGLTELFFYTNDAANSDANEAPVPVKVTARKHAKFLQASSQVIFEGDCQCTMPQTDLSEPKDATLSAQKITVNVPKDESGNMFVSSDILAGGPVELDFYVEDTSAPIEPVVLSDPNESNEPNDVNDVKDIVPVEKFVPVKVTAQKQAMFMPESNRIIFDGDCVCSMPQRGLSPRKDCTFSSPQLTVNLADDESEQSLSDIYAAGPAEFAFYVEDSTGSDANVVLLPAKVTAQKQAGFSARSNKIVFEGDCRCTTKREDPNVMQEFVLSAPKFTVDLADANDRASGQTDGIKLLTADGGTVMLGTVKRAKAEPNLVKEVQSDEAGKLLGGVQLKCVKFEYVPNHRLFVATGPGILTVNNSRIAEPEQQTGRFSLHQPCYAFLRNFDTLKYFVETNRVFAEAAEQEMLLVNYIPVVDGRYGDGAEARASRVEAVLYETPDGQTGLAALTASDGIRYDDDKGNIFVGSELFYNHDKSLITVEGDESQLCYWNGAVVDAIQYDLVTGKVETRVVAPGALQIDR